MTAPERLLLSFGEACRILDMSEKTLRDHVKNGDIAYVLPGRGKRRPRRKFAMRDLEDFIERQRRRDACPSIGLKAPPTTTTTSSSNVIGFTARRRQRTAAKPKG